MSRVTKDWLSPETSVVFEWDWRIIGGSARRSSSAEGRFDICEIRFSNVWTRPRTGMLRAFVGLSSLWTGIECLFGADNLGSIAGEGCGLEPVDARRSSKLFSEASLALLSRWVKSETDGLLNSSEVVLRSMPFDGEETPPFPWNLGDVVLLNETLVGDTYFETSAFPDFRPASSRRKDAVISCSFASLFLRSFTSTARVSFSALSFSIKGAFGAFLFLSCGLLSRRAFCSRFWDLFSNILLLSDMRDLVDLVDFAGLGGFDWLSACFGGSENAEASCIILAFFASLNSSSIFFLNSCSSSLSRMSFELELSRLLLPLLSALFSRRRSSCFDWRLSLDDFKDFISSSRSRTLADRQSFSFANLENSSWFACFSLETSSWFASFAASKILVFSVSRDWSLSDNSWFRFDVSRYLCSSSVTSCCSFLTFSELSVEVSSKMTGFVLGVLAPDPLCLTPRRDSTSASRASNFRLATWRSTSSCWRSFASCSLVRLNSIELCWSLSSISISWIDICSEVPLPTSRSDVNLVTSLVFAASSDWNVDIWLCILSISSWWDRVFSLSSCSRRLTSSWSWLISSSWALICCFISEASSCADRRRERKSETKFSLSPPSFPSSDLTSNSR